MRHCVARLQYDIEERLFSVWLKADVRKEDTLALSNLLGTLPGTGRSARARGTCLPLRSPPSKPASSQTPARRK